jgi:hypothetical protein
VRKLRIVGLGNERERLPPQLVLGFPPKRVGNHPDDDHSSQFRAVTIEVAHSNVVSGTSYVK